MRGLRLAVFTLLAAGLEVSFFGAWRPLGVIPDLFLVFILLSSLIVPASEALLMALGGGLLLDFVSGADFGLRTAYFCFLVLLVVMIRRTGADFERWSMKLAAIVSATILYDLAILISLLNSHWWQYGRVILGSVSSELLLNVILMLLLSRPLRYLLGLRTQAVPDISRH